MKRSSRGNTLKRLAKKHPEMKLADIAQFGVSTGPTGYPVGESKLKRKMAARSRRINRLHAQRKHKPSTPRSRKEK